MWLSYKLLVAALATAGVAFWVADPRLGAVGFAVLAGGLALIAAPLAVPLLVGCWARAWRKRAGYPPEATDLDLIEFVGEEAVRAGIAIEWRRRMLRPDRVDSFQTAGDGPVVIVSIACGVLTVETPAVGAVRFVDPLAAADHMVAACRGTLAATRP